MENVELLQAVSELVTTARIGIAEVVQALSAEADDEALESALQTCTTCIDMIVMAAEMAELTDLQQHCLAINASLQALQSDAGRYLQAHGQHVMAWSQAIEDYLGCPDEVALPACWPLMEAAAHADPLPTAALAAPDATADATPAAWLHGPDVAWSEDSATGPPAAPQPAAALWAATAAEDPTAAAMADTVALVATHEDNVADHVTRLLAAEEDTETHVTATSPAETPTHALDIPLAENAPMAASPWLPANVSDTVSRCEDIWEAVTYVDVVESADDVEDRALDDVQDRALEADEEAASAEADGEQPASAEVDGEQPASAEVDGEQPASAEADGEQPASAEVDGEQPASAEADGEEDVDVADFFSMVQEIRAICAALDPWHAILAGAETTAADAAAAAQAHGSLVDHLQASIATLGLPGFDTVCAHIKQNVALLATQTPAVRAAAGQLLEQWTTLVRAYLQDPSNETQGFAIVAQLQQETWPTPLAAEQAEALYAALSPEATDEGPVFAERPTVAQPEDVILDMGDDVNPRLLKVFLQESPANAADFSACISRIGHGVDVFTNLRIAQRLAHNIKGSANLVGIPGVANLTHHVEDILEYLSEHRVEPAPPLVHTLQEAADCVEMMFEALQGSAAPPAEAQRVLQDVFDWANRMDTGQLDTAMAYTAPVVVESTVPAGVESPIPAGALAAVDHEAALAASPARPAAESTSEPPPATSTPGKVLRVPVTTVDRLYRMVGEMSIALDQLQGRFVTMQRQSNALTLQNRQIQQRRFEVESFVDVRHVSRTQQHLRRIGGGREVFDPLELNEYDELYSASRGFIEAVTDSTQMQQQMRSELSSVEHMLGQMQRLKRDLETVVRSTRMEEVSTLSARLQRSVRQACRVTGKQAELAIEGAEVLLDSETLDKLADPLMHILRNAVDHGIEPSEQRLQRGKAPVGTICLRFFQEANTVVVQCSDDGQGLDYPRIQESAISKGLLRRDEAVSPQALARLTLTPGFSTRTTATQLSGRGVGLDVVYTAIKELKGVMEIGDAPTGGCQIALRVPLTLLTSHCLVVRVAGQSYAIPTSAVARALPPRTGHLSAMGRETAFAIGQEIYPARALAQYVHLANGDAATFTPDQEILLVYSDTGVVALTIDQLLDSYHLVVKSLGPYIKAVPGVVGVATLADGNLLPVLDIAELLRAPTHAAALSGQQPTLSAAVAPPAVSKVLIVDDSMSVRQSLAELLEDAGYQPLLAHDGVEAVEIMRTQVPDLVLTDLEMPRMNGLELVSYIRTTYRRDLPVVVLTSRTTQKHRQQAMDAGVNLYVTKPYAEEALLHNIQALLH